MSKLQQAVNEKMTSWQKQAEHDFVLHFMAGGKFVVQKWANGFQYLIPKTEWANASHVVGMETAKGLAKKCLSHMRSNLKKQIRETLDFNNNKRCFETHLAKNEVAKILLQEGIDYFGEKGIEISHHDVFVSEESSKVYIWSVESIENTYGHPLFTFEATHFFSSNKIYVRVL